MFTRVTTCLFYLMVEFIDDGDDLIIKNLIDWPTVTYSMNVSTANMYRLTIQMEPEGTVSFDYLRYPIEISINGVVIGETVAVTNRGAVAEGFVYTPWLVPGSYEVECRFNRFARSTRDIRIHALELSTVEGADIDGNGKADWIDARMGADVDTDGDGLSDIDEVLLYGTDSLSADSDNDGLNDGEEITLGSDPLDADTDNDGVSDGVEVDELLTNLLVAEFDGSALAVDHINGSEVVAMAGEWDVDGTELLSKDRRGWVEYMVDFPEQDIYCLNINATHLWDDQSCNPMLPIDTSHLQISVDGLYVGSYPLVAADSVYVDVRAFLPALSAGEHTVRIFWENTSGRLAIKIRELELQQLGGPDADGDDTKDWVQASLGNMTSVDSALQSVVSPICLEGVARYVPLMSLVSQASSLPCLQSAGSRWYANISLNQDDLTDVTVSFQNGAFERTVQAEWIPYNLIEHNGETLVIREGDMVKFVALPEDANGGQFELEFLVTAEGETVRSPNTRPLIYSFPEAGIYTVSGAYTHGNDTETASIQVRVVDWEFSGETPACMVGRTREWTVDFPEGATLETDESVELEVLEVAPITNNESQITVSLKASSANGDHTLVSRLYPGGPVLATTKLAPFWVQNASDGYFKIVERYEDSELWEINSIVKNLPDTVDLQIKVIIGGVTLDDYTLERWNTNEVYDETGQYNFRLLHPNNSNFSVCHTFKVYQGGVFVGEAFGGGQDDVGEE